MAVVAGTLYLNKIREVTQVTEGKALSLMDQCVRCLYHNGHANGIRLKVIQGKDDSHYEVRWPDDVPTNEELKQSYDNVESAERGAEAIALLLISQITQFTSVYRSVRGTRIDYFLGYKPTNPNNPFKNSSRLEVSGIMTENIKNTVRARIKEKVSRLTKSDSTFPAYIIVVEFGLPYAIVELKS
jgi:hypothetical protein